MIAAKWGVSREELDEFAAQSHCRAAAAQRNGWTRSKIFALNGLESDEGVRSNPDLAKNACAEARLSRRRRGHGREFEPDFRWRGRGTAGERTAADELGLRKRARIVARAVVGSDPELMLTGPIPATQKALTMAGLRVEDIDAFEINEAFACVPLVWAREIRPTWTG